MAAEEKKRGRPKKKDSVLPNEEVDKVTMTQNAITPSYELKEKGVGNVRSVPEKITLDAIQTRWKAIFSKYSSLGF